MKPNGVFAGGTSSLCKTFHICFSGLYLVLVKTIALYFPILSIFPPAAPYQSPAAPERRSLIYGRCLETLM